MGYLTVREERAVPPDVPDSTSGKRTAPYLRQHNTPSQRFDAVEIMTSVIVIRSTSTLL